MTLEYAEYNDLVEIIDKSSAETAYQDLMAKEVKVLDTVNNVIKYYKDNEIKNQEFINMPLSMIINLFFNTWIKILEDVIKSRTLTDFYQSFTKDDRKFYIGIMCIIISVFLFFV